MASVDVFVLHIWFLEMLMEERFVQWQNLPARFHKEGDTEPRNPLNGTQFDGTNAAATAVLTTTSCMDNANHDKAHEPLLAPLDFPLDASACTNPICNSVEVLPVTCKFLNFLEG